MTSGDVTFTALDDTHINADAGSGALAVASNGGDVGAIAIGAAAAQNEINAPTIAAIRDANVTGDDVTVEATSTAVIDAFTLGVAGAINADGGAVALAGAGSGSGNFITGGVNAIIDPSTITATGAVTVTATDSSSIDATAGAASISINVGTGTNVGVGLGIALAINEIDREALAIIDDTTVDAGGAVERRRRRVPVRSTRWPSACR